MQQEIVKPNWREVCRVFNAFFDGDMNTKEQFHYLLNFVADRPDLVKEIEDDLKPPANVIELKKVCRR